MATTIMVENSTKQMLESLKEEKGVSSFDKVIMELVRKEKKIPKSMFGIDKGRKLKIERLKFHELKLPHR